MFYALNFSQSVSVGPFPDCADILQEISAGMQQMTPNNSKYNCPVGRRSAYPTTPMFPLPFRLCCMYVFSSNISCSEGAGP